MVIAIAIQITIGLYLAVYVFGPFLQKMLGYIWEDPTIKQQAAVIQRMKELCIDANVPEESAKIMVATERNITLEVVNTALEGLDMSTIRDILQGKGGRGKLLLGQLNRTIKGYKAGL